MSGRDRPDPAATLAEAVATHAGERPRLVVAFSGGPDSTLLLALAVECFGRRRVRAVHVDHGWRTDTADWADHCRQLARALGVGCDVERVDARARAGEGPEAAARAARYEALRARLGPGDVLLTAHHRDDQAETLLLALLRGGGVHGWAGMPVARALGAGLHLRPWLELSRAELRAALERRGLPAIEDPANADPAYDRVWLRHEILPALRARRPGVDATLARAAAQAAAAAAGVDALAAHDYVRCRGAADATLDCGALASLPAARQRALLRWWIARAGLPRPPAARLETLRRQLTGARPDRSPRVHWRGGEVRRWRGLAWALAPLAPVEPGAEFVWADRSRPLVLPHRRLHAADLAALGVAPAADADVRVRLPRPGQRVRPPESGRARSLTAVLRAAGLPPWERARAPLVYVDGALVGVVGVGRMDAA